MCCLSAEAKWASRFLFTEPRRVTGPQLQSPNENLLSLAEATASLPASMARRFSEYPVKTGKHGPEPEALSEAEQTQQANVTTASRGVGRRVQTDERWPAGSVYSNRFSSLRRGNMLSCFRSRCTELIPLPFFFSHENWFILSRFEPIFGKCLVYLKRNVCGIIKSNKALWKLQEGFPLKKTHL